jgi:uncharacterized protein
MDILQRFSAKAWLAALLHIKQRELIFRPVKQSWEGINRTDLGFQELWLTSSQIARDQGSLYAWWLPDESANAPAILFLHGASWNLSWHVDRISRWRAMGFSVLGIDYRGFGLSPGELPTEAGAYADAQRGWDHLRRLAPAASQRLVYGHSLGGAIAIELAARNPDLAGVIVESTFTSIRDMARVRTSAARFLPVDAILNHRFDSLSKIPKLNAPLLILHGTADEVVPHRMSEALYAEARALKQLVLFPGLGHSNIPIDSFPRYRLAVKRFVKRVIRT